MTKQGTILVVDDNKGILTAVQMLSLIHICPGQTLYKFLQAVSSAPYPSSTSVSYTHLDVYKRQAQQLSESVSYHIDHGNGLDYYKVGPTLGAGTSALLANDSIVYPYCYKDYQILDNGPLRFTVKLVYNPLTRCV